MVKGAERSTGSAAALNAASIVSIASARSRTPGAGTPQTQECYRGRFRDLAGLFGQTAAELFAPETAAVFVDRAERIATSLKLAMFFRLAPAVTVCGKQAGFGETRPVLISRKERIPRDS
ncbi:hypothetical protein [Mesorhizobium sp.]|uniref:hypothetical protein n=1 Tax=Mesorhizobium sp. TaxID=1871066 RepID=UPI0025BAF14D|nr:hypothetical protein [Mesorhizobium sp.]